ncbi:MAG: alpha/beta hydrolase [Holophagae bacterium]|jgi:pimeloyl-ACP methyl ester carboxylesterase
MLFGLVMAWLGWQIYQTTRPVKLSGHHPFRSPAKQQLYLDQYDARSARWPVPSETRMVETSLGPTFVRISGPLGGPPLVLLPGANSTLLLWEPNIEDLSRNHRVFAVDTIFDFGRSIYTRKPESADDFVKWMDDLLSGLGLDQPINLAGLSYGGWISSQYGLQRPDRVRRLVLLAPAATVLPFSADFIKKGLLCVIPHRRFIDDMIEWALTEAARGTPEQQRMVQDAADNAWLGLRCFKPVQMVHPTILSDEQWRSLVPPTLFMVGEHEVIYAGTAADAVGRVNAVAPQVKTLLVANCGHDLTLAQAALVDRAIIDFIDDADGLQATANGNQE